MYVKWVFFKSNIYLILSVWVISVLYEGYQVERAQRVARRQQMFAPVTPPVRQAAADSLPLDSVRIPDQALITRP